MNYYDLEYNATEFSKKRFPNATKATAITKITEEFGELASAVNATLGNDVCTGKGDVALEAADVLITLMVLIGRFFPEIDVLIEVDAKLRILNDPNSGHKAALIN